MKLWRVDKFYGEGDGVWYDASPYNLVGHLKCCITYYGWKGLKYTYLSKRRAQRVADRLNKELEKHGYL